MSVYPLIPGVQSYDWAQYAEATPELQFQREDEKPYAELWMGTHPSCPSKLLLPDGSTPLLTDYLREHRDLVGEDIASKFAMDSSRGALPFLFKVLSISKALSIQAHPDQTLAAQLHKDKPTMYKEIAIALRPFEGFCGFRPLEAIATFIESVPELREVLGADDELMQSLRSAAAASSERTDHATPEEGKAALRNAFQRLMRAQPDVYEPAVQRLVQRCKASPDGIPQDLAELMVRIDSQFPSDIGVLCAFFLNVVHLQPGESVFLAANEPHAYISGQILECMAASDNVVRAGLTPKARDVDVLVDMLTYTSAGAQQQQLQPPRWDGDQRGHSLLYDPPVPEFSVVVTKVAHDETSEHRAVAGPSILLVTEGDAELRTPDAEPMTLREGCVYFIGAGTPVSVRATSPECSLGRAFVEVGSSA